MTVVEDAHLVAYVGAVIRCLVQGFEEQAEDRYEHDERCQAFVRRHPEGATRDEVGLFFGVTRTTIQRVEATAMERLRRHHPELLESWVEVVQRAPSHWEAAMLHAEADHSPEEYLPRRLRTPPPVGSQHGAWTVIGERWEHEEDGPHRLARVRCQCGTEALKRLSDLHDRSQCARCYRYGYHPEQLGMEWSAA